MSVDEQLKAIKANDEEVTQRLYVENYDRVKKFVLRNNGTEDDAKDIYQEAYLSLWRNIKMDRFSSHHDGALEAYLFQIARFKWLDHLRTLRFRQTVQLEPDNEGLMTFEELDDITEKRILIVKTHFRLLGEGCRRLLSRFYHGKESLKEIAKDMGWTEATAKNNKYRCMEKLRSMIKK